MIANYKTILFKARGVFMQNFKPFELYIRYNIVTDKYDFYFIANVGGERKLAQPVEFVFSPIDPNKSYYPPTFSFDTAIAKMFLQSIANELENLGIKKPEEYRLEGVLEATKYHLEDMRRLVFKNENTKK